MTKDTDRDRDADKVVDKPVVGSETRHAWETEPIPTYLSTKSTNTPASKACKGDTESRKSRSGNFRSRNTSAARDATPNSSGAPGKQSRVTEKSPIRVTRASHPRSQPEQSHKPVRRGSDKDTSDLRSILIFESSNSSSKPLEHISRASSDRADMQTHASPKRTVEQRGSVTDLRNVLQRMSQHSDNEIAKSKSTKAAPCNQDDPGDGERKKIITVTLKKNKQKSSSAVSSPARKMLTIEELKKTFEDMKEWT